MTRSVMRFVRFLTTQDPDAEPLYAAECVTGCENTSGSWTAPDEVDRWMSMHSAGTGHSGFRRTFTDYATVTRGQTL